MIEFGVLGPLTVYRDHQPVAVNASMLRELLTLLLHRPGTPLAVAAIEEALWPGEPPATARKTIQVYVGRLRRALRDEDRIRHGPGGYSIVVGPDELDTIQFRTLIESGRDNRDRGDLASADCLLTRGLGLWRGTPFTDLDGVNTVAEETLRLEEQRLVAHGLRAAIRLDLRRHHEVVTDLAGLLSAHPYHERLASYLMLALYRSDRQSEALDLYRRTRNRLAEELGIEPGPSMSWLHQAILRGDDVLGRITATDLDEPGVAPVTVAVTAAATPARTAAVVPAQLPPDVFGFTGRSNELDSLDNVIARSGDQPGAVVISAVSGTAGVGKTALAVHWAHRVRHRFPDGQLYINLRGFDPTGTVMAPAEAIRRVLDAFHVPPQRVPADPHAQADLYRSLLADKRMLVVLDNARDPGQVRPLLPGAPGCLVLITSRNRLTGLVAAEGAHPLALDLLTRDDARDLLIRRLGPDRIAAEPEAVDDVIARCARLPLALAIVAATAATHPHLTLASFADHLGDSRELLDTLATGDAPATDVRAVFSWSYQALTADSARLFRLLGLHPGPDVSIAAAASLAALPIDRVRSQLSELVGAHLINEHARGRYSFHDLLRAYAVDVAATTDSDDERRAATERALDHYLHTAYACARLLDPARDALTLAAARCGVVPEELVDHEQALDWFTAEYRVLLAAVDHAAVTGFDTHTWQLAWTLDTFLNRRGLWHDQAATKQAAVAAAARLGDLAAQGRAQRYLARAHIRLGHLDEADNQLRCALDLTAQAGDRVEQAYAYHALAHVRERQGRPSDALDYAQRALELFQVVGHRQGQGLALNAVGWYHALLGDHLQALGCCQRALAMFQGPGDRLGLAATWDSVGYAHRHLGNYAEAISCYQQALAVYRELGDRFNEADTLANFGDTHRDADDPEAARTAWQEALAILDQLDHPDAEALRAKLADLDRP